MKTRGRRLTVPAIGAAIATLAIAAPAPRAGAAPAAACTATSGVTVIVDLTHFHLDIERGCAPGRPANALAALRSAGFDTAGTAQYGDAFLCRINDLPTTAKESCSRTPPANSSWSFYWARPTDAAWTYSTAGVTSFRPAAGSLIGFAFGNYAKPGVRPSAVTGAPAPTTPPTTAPAPTVATAGAPVSTTTAPATATATTTSSGARLTPVPAPTATTARPRAAGAAAPTTPAGSSTTPRVVERTAAAGDVRSSSGSPRPAVLALMLVAILGVAGGLTIRARRRRPA